MDHLRADREPSAGATTDGGGLVAAEQRQHLGVLGARAGLRGSIRFGISALILVGLGLLVDWRSLGVAARSISLTVLALCAAILVVQVLIGAWRANLFLHIAGSRTNPAPVFQAYALSVLANAFLLNFVAGAIARIFLLHRHQVSVSVSIATIVAEKVIVFVTLSGLAAVAALARISTVNRQIPSPREAMFLLGIGIVVIAITALTARIWGRFLLSLLQGGTRATLERCLSLLAARTAWLVGTGATLLSLLCAWAAYTLLARAMGIEDAGPMIALVLPLVSVIASLPISIGGWGVRELSFGALLYGFGVPTEKAILVTAIASLLGIVAAFVVAVAIFAGKRRPL